MIAFPTAPAGGSGALEGVKRCEQEVIAGEERWGRTAGVMA